MKTHGILTKIIAVALILLAFVNCEKVDTNLITDPVDNENSILLDKRGSTSIRTVSFNEIPNVASKIQTLIEKESFANKKNKISPIINTKNILEVTDSLKRKNYSFGMLVKENGFNGPRLYNLIVSVDSTGRMSDPKVLRFKPKNGYEEEWLENDLDLSHFTGKVSIHNYTAFFNDNPFAAAGEDLCPPEFDEYGDPIVCIENDISGGSGGGGSSDGGALVPAGGGSSPDNGGSTSCSFSYYWNYCGGTNENEAHAPAPVCGGDGSGAGWVLEIDCPEYSTNYYFMETGRSTDCPSCASGPSGDVAVNTYAKSVTKLQSSLGNIGYELSYSELTWLNLNDSKAYDLMQPIINDSWAPETVNTSLLSLFKEMANDGWVPKSGTVGNRAALKYTHYYEPNMGESMYLLENGLVLYQSQTERRINKVLEGTIASTEPPTDGYNYIYSYETNKWYGYLVPQEDYAETDLTFLFNEFWKKAKFVGRYILPIEDAIIIVDGKDWDGVEQNRVTSAGFMIMDFIPGGKLAKPVAKASKTALKWLLIAKEGTQTVVKVINKLPTSVLSKFDSFAVSGATNSVDDLIRAGTYTDDVAIEVSEVIGDLYQKLQRKLNWTEIQAFLKRGRDFNNKAKDFYEFNEVTLKSGKRLDSYIHGKEIISRKATTLSEIQTSTFQGYLKELITKYPKGAAINAPKYGDTFVNKTLSGDYFLEIPLSNKTFFENSPIFQKVLNKFNVDNNVLVKIKYLAE